MAINYKKCLRCNKSSGVKILYGMPALEAVQLVREGKIVLGGCIVDINQPEYECMNCHNKWNSSDSIDGAYSQIKGIHFTVGGFHEGYHIVKVDFEKAEVVCEYNLLQNTIKKRIKDVELEVDMLKMLRLMEWKSSYVNEHILDGEQWSIEIVRTGRTLHKSGSNAYPKQWDVFGHWINQLVGKKVVRSYL